MTDTVLLVIDVQESFKHRPYWNEQSLPSFQTKLLKLIETSLLLGCISCRRKLSN
ncbi:MAG: hypothetical protein ACH34X_05880 [Thiolinea sp.]